MGGLCVGEGCVVGWGMNENESHNKDSEETRKGATDVDAGAVVKEGADADTGTNAETTMEVARRGAAELGEEAQLLDASNMALASGTVYLAGSAELSVFQPETAQALDESSQGKVAKIRLGNGRIGMVESFSPHPGTGHYHLGITGLESDE